MKLPKPLTMRSKILLSCLLFLMAALLIQMLLFQRYSGQIIYQQARSSSEGALENLQDDLYALFKGAENSLLNLYMNKPLIADMEAGLDGETLANRYQSTAYDLAYSAFDSTQNLVALYLYTPDHRLISAYRHAQTPKYTYPADIYDGSMADNAGAVRAYVASDETAMLISSYYNEKRGAVILRNVLKLRAQNGRLIGYAVCDLGPKAYDALISKYRYSDDEVIWLQRSGGKPVMASTGPEALVSIQTKAASAITAGEKPNLPGNYELFQAGQHKYLLNAYLLMPQSVLMANQSALNRVTLLVYALVALLFTLLYLLLSRSLTHPLTETVRAMQEIKAGHRERRLANLKSDEFGMLGASFNEMLDQLELYTKREVASRLMLNDAKYKALQAQINPHFLYNTLDTMGAVARFEHVELVASLCRALSSMFRYSLDMSDAYATLEDELGHLKNYTEIIGVRMQNSIEFDIEVPETLLKERLPRLSLQPLVENAVQHGLKNKRGEKRVRIRAAKEDGRLVVRVEDNGVGMDVEKINRMLESDDADALSRADSIGLANIHARLRLLLGPDSGLTVAAAEGGGSVVSLILPGGGGSVD
mgnify:CR=1 FL=1